MNKIKINVKTNFLPDLSKIEKSIYYFLYEISIKNESNNKVKLISRHWNIYNSYGEVKKIDGEGVIGQKPVIDSGEIFTYNSYCPINTAFGSMDGFYTMTDHEKNIFKVKIPEFSLILPDMIN